METNRPEITAEWTVRAHLTISRPADNLLQRVALKRDNDSVITDERTSETRNTFPTESPAKVVYKWCSDDLKPASEPAHTDGYSTFRRSNFMVTENHYGKNDSFHSTEVPPSDSGFSTSTTNVGGKSPFNARFRSTCNIVLSASTDLIPRPNELGDNLSTRCHTTFPDQEVPFSESEIEIILDN